MNTTALIMNWNQQKDMFKQKLAHDTNSNFLFEEMKKDLMFGRLQIKNSRMGAIESVKVCLIN
jgi:hypothetical protein